MSLRKICDKNMCYYTNYFSPVGKLTIASDGVNIIGLWIEGQKYFKETISGKIEEKNDLEIFIKTRKWLDRYFKGEKTRKYRTSAKSNGN